MSSKRGSEEVESESVPKIVEEDEVVVEEEDKKALEEDEIATLSQNLVKNDEIEQPETKSASQLAREEFRQQHFEKLKTENKVYLTIGRMNPPTPGHKLLIKGMIREALANGLSQVSIILSSTLDADKNLLFGEEKRRFIYKIIERIKQEIIEEASSEGGGGEGGGGGPGGGPDIEAQINEFVVEIICMDDPTLQVLGKHPIIKSLRYILSLYGNDEREEGNKPKIVLKIGQDRANDYNWLPKSFPTNEFAIEPIPRDVGAISATYVRSLVSPGDNEHANKSHFLEIMKPTGLEEVEIAEIYGIIYDVKKQGSAVEEQEQQPKKKSSKKESAGGRTQKQGKRYKTKQSRYRYGRKSRRRSRRKKRHHYHMSTLPGSRSH